MINMKKNRELLNIIGDIDDDMIEKARPDMTKKRIRIWPGILSTAALLAVIAGLQYRYIFMPLADGKNGTVPAGTAVTEVTDRFSDKFAETGEQNSSDSNGIWKMKKINPEAENCIIKNLYTGDDGNLWVSYDGTYTSGYITAEYDGIRYDFGKLIEGNLQNGPLNICTSDDHIYVHYGKGLYSAEKSIPDQVYRADGSSFYSETELGGETRMLGADTSGNVYMLNREYSDSGIVFSLFCYSPDLKLRYRESGSVFEMDSIFNGDVIPGILDTACGFDEIHISEKNLIITYGGNCVMRYSFESGEYSSDMKFETEFREVSAESGVYREGWYTEAEDENGVKTLKMCTYRITDNADNHDRTEDGGKIFTCFDEAAVVKCEPDEKPYSRAENYDESGNRLADVMYDAEEYSIDERKSDVPFSLSAYGFTEDNITGLSKQKDGTYVFISEKSLYSADARGEVTRICGIDREYFTSEKIVKIDDTHFALPPSSLESTRDYFWIVEKP